MERYPVYWKSDALKSENEEMIKLMMQQPEFQDVSKATAIGLADFSVCGGWDLREVLQCITVKNYECLATEYEATLGCGKIAPSEYMKNMVLHIQQFHKKKNDKCHCLICQKKFCE